MLKRLPTVTGKDGLSGVLLDGIPPSQSNEPVRIELANGSLIDVPGSLLVEQANGSYYIPIGSAELPVPSDKLPPLGEVVIPVLAEELTVTKRRVQTGGVRVRKLLHERQEVVDILLLKEHVDVRHVMIDREVDAPLPVRREGDTTIIPIVEEVLIVEKRLPLKEEIHITRHTRTERHQERVTLRHEEAQIEELNEHRGPEPAPREPAPPPGDLPSKSRRVLRKSILGES